MNSRCIFKTRHKLSLPLSILLYYKIAKLSYCNFKVNLSNSIPEQIIIPNWKNRLLWETSSQEVLYEHLLDCCLWKSTNQTLCLYLKKHKMPNIFNKKPQIIYLHVLEFNLFFVPLNTINFVYWLNYIVTWFTPLYFALNIWSVITGILCIPYGFINANL